MMKNPPEGYQRMIPYLLYEDAPAALAFLDKAFGFEERARMPGEGGAIMHAEVTYGGNVVMLATVPETEGYAGPKGVPTRSSMVLCYVDDVDTHYARAKAAGATILATPEDQFYGDRTYRARDPEGHEWNFHTHVRDIAPEDMQPPAG